MPSFLYEAMSRGGERVRGELIAQNRTEAFRKLDRDRLQPIKIQEKDGSKAGSPAAVQPVEQPRRHVKIRLSRGQIILFTEELSDLLDAGLQIEQALRVMEARKELSKIKQIATDLRQRVREGSSLSNALRQVSSSFGDLYCNLVSAGEVSGSLPQLLKRQASFLMTIDDLQKKVVSALIYPAMIFVLGLGLIFLFMTYLVPQMTVLFEKTGKNIPFLTRLLIEVSAFFSHYWWAILGAIALISISFWQFIRLPRGRKWWHRAQLKIPVVGSVLRGRFYAQFAQTLANLLSNGLPLLNALQLMRGATLNEFWRRSLMEVTDYVGEGGAFSRGLQRFSDFPSLFIDMVAVGEQTGDLAKALDKVGKKYDKELDIRIQRLTSMVQPLIIVVMAGMVGLIAYSIINGIFDAVSGLQAR
jgi:type II secretory pathway component PulF